MQSPAHTSNGSPAEPATAVALVSHHRDTVTVVTAALQDSSGFELQKVCSDLGALTLLLERTPMPFVLVDIDSNPAGMLADLDPLSRRFSDTRFIVVCEQVSDELMLEAMQVGVRHVLSKRTVPAKLAGALQRLLPKADGVRDRAGVIVTVLSASGGCGATTLALNLANELSLEPDKHALLLDLDVTHGGAAAYLGLRSPYGLADVLSRNGDLDPQLLRSTAQSYSDRFDVLSSLSTLDLNAPPQLDAEHLVNVIRACREVYDYTVVDAPRLAPALSAELIGVSTLALLVMQLTVKDVTIAKALLSAVANHRITADQITVVINRYSRRHAMISLDEARRALGNPEIVPIGNDYRSALKCVNHGRLLSDSSPRSALRHQLRQLGQQLWSNSAAKRR